MDQLLTSLFPSSFISEEAGVQLQYVPPPLPVCARAFGASAAASRDPRQTPAAEQAETRDQGRPT